MALDSPGWHLIGSFPEGDPDGVGSWLLHHGGEAMVLEAPPGLTAAAARAAADSLGVAVRWLAASHDHYDHLDGDAWEGLRAAFPAAAALHPADLPPGDHLLEVGGEPLWLVKAPKHSLTDVVTVFRGVAMTGDVELGTLRSCNREVRKPVRAASMAFLRDFPARTGYRVHSAVSAHLNDVRRGVDWPALFAV